MATQKKRLISICTGYGGLDLGLELAGVQLEPLVYLEREITVVKRLVARFKDGSLHEADIWSDLRTFDGRPYKGRTDILTAGYPCQPFSCAGRRRGKKDVRHLWPEVARVIRETEARQVFLENVDAHLRLGGLEVMRELSGMGYRVAAGLFAAEEVGAPHRRLRLFILAELADARHEQSPGRIEAAEGQQRGSGRQSRCELASQGGSLAQRTGRGRGELRQSPGGFGLIDGGGTQLADGKHKGLRIIRSAHNSDGCDAPGYDADGRNPAVEDTARAIGSRQVGEGSRGRRGVREAGTAVADGNSAVRRPHNSGSGGQGQQEAAVSRSRGKAVADGQDSDRRKREKVVSIEAGQRGRGPRGYGEGFLFPPGPEELAAWGRLLVQHPDLEPALCGALNGRSGRVDRLRALGNGVVPLVAAHAYRTLRADLDAAA